MLKSARVLCSDIMTDNISNMLHNFQAILWHLNFKSRITIQVPIRAIMEELKNWGAVHHMPFPFSNQSSTDPKMKQMSCIKRLVMACFLKFCNDNGNKRNQD
ncbi:UNVERIFIED_CONTAM: hypothetical protein NCL1_44493 [Trichonephila clavipes]